MALSFSSSLLLPCMLLILQSFTPDYTTALTHKINHFPTILPLRISKISSSANSEQPKKLLFHHNVSLVVSLSVGSPPQDLSMVLDTGSKLSWLVCNSNHPKCFKSTSSRTYRTIPCKSSSCQIQEQDLPIPPDCDQRTKMCHMSVSYADTSTSSGSTFDSTSASTTGLLGMNRGTLSFIIQSRIHKFAYCISDRDNSGILLLGGNVSIPSLNYTPLVEISRPLPYFDRLAYSVQIEGIRVSNVALPIPKSVFLLDHTGAGQTMLDSGTQFTFSLGKAYSALKEGFLQQTKNILTELKEPNFMFQEVTLILKGVEVTVTSNLLLYRVPGEVRGNNTVWCFTFGNSDLVPLSAFVIGHHHQQKTWVEYDLRNNRIGIARARCDQEL
ncbi:hypothetical protein LUZ61_010972 [Rhynchospora tenuis]|uniref:Peptidase A1 domain-containing protein n=1 Tax=Rhynchospora tenuis TaxID=198213 RepID=A0AAD6A049_9POAL|nr:hypothetical protein LUZ61_010972 [Rhynchospora tenuis]